MFLHNLLNVLVQTANQMGLQKKKFLHRFACTLNQMAQSLLYTIFNMTAHGLGYDSTVGIATGFMAGV
jgi:hypothetical protein